MTTKKRVRVSTAIKHVYQLIDPASPESAALALNLAAETVMADLGYETDEAWRLVRWLAGQSRDANWSDLAEEWCEDHCFPVLECRACLAYHDAMATTYTDAKLTQWYAKYSPNGICPRCKNRIPHTPKAIVPHYQGTCLTVAPAPTALSLEEQRRILHKTGMFDEMGNFKVPE